MVNFYENIKKRIKNVNFKIDSNAKKTIVCLFIVYVIAISSLIRANFNYMDDLGRVFIGYDGWDFFSRYTSNFLSHIIHTNSFLVDISPLPQLLACFILSIASYIVIKSFSKDNKFSFWNVLAILPLGLSPYFIGCLTFKYDAPYMALSLLASVFPILFINDKKWKFSIITIICMLLMCTTYQASSGIFPMLIIFYCFNLWNDKKENFKEVLKKLAFSAVNYLIGLGIFKLFIMKPVRDYVSNVSVPLKSIIPTFLKNIIEYYRYVVHDFRKIWLIIIALIVISFIIVLVVNSKQKKYKSLIVTLIVLIVTSLLAFGVYPILEAPLFSPRAMYGFGALIAFVALNALVKDKFIITKILCFSLSWCFIVFSLQYGNALSEQKNYTDFRIRLLISDLNGLKIMNNEKEKTIKIEGDIGRAPSIKEIDYGVLEGVVPYVFKGNGEYWGRYYFKNFFGLKNITLTQSGDFDELPILKESMYHTIKGDDDKILIILK